jgi:hypothetical protein
MGTRLLSGRSGVNKVEQKPHTVFGTVLAPATLSGPLPDRDIDLDLHRVGRLTAVTGATSMAIDSGRLRSNLSAT